MAGLIDYLQGLLSGFGKVSGAMKKPEAPQPTPFDPYGTGYDYETAKQYGLVPDATGRWPSRVPQTGMLLKGSTHETWPLTMEEEVKLGNKIIFKEGRFYSVPDTSQEKQISDMDAILESLKLWKGTRVD